MPFDPGQGNNLLPLLLQYSLNQRMRDEERAQNEEMIAQRRSEEAFDQAVQLIPQVGYKAAVSLVGPYLPTDRLEGLKGLEKALKQRQAEEASRSEALAAAPQLGQLAAPTIDERGQITPSGQSAQIDSQLRSLLSMAGPEFAPIAQQRFALAQQEKERSLREERARLKEQRSFAIRDRATEKADERDYAKNENLTTYLTSRVAEQFAMGQQPDPDALVEELRGLGKPLERARSIVNEAIFAGKGKALEIQRSDEGQYGKQPQVRSIEAEVERLLERFPNADPVKLKRDVTLSRDNRLVRDPLAESILEENAEFAAQRGEAAPPIGPVWFEVGTKAGAQKFEERRNAQEKSLSGMERMEGTFGILSDKIASRQISPEFVATEGWTGLMSALGTNDPDLAAFQNATFDMMIGKVTATQGGRNISDKDLAFYMNLMPTLQEVAFSPETARAKIVALRSALHEEIIADTNPEMRRRLQQERGRLPLTKRQREVAARARKLLVEMEGLEPEKAAAKFTQFMGLRDEMESSQPGLTRAQEQLLGGP